MNILNQDFSLGLAILAYGGLSIHFWRARWSQASASPATAMGLGERGMIALAMAMHAAGLYGRIFTGETMQFSFALAASIMLLLATLTYWLESFSSRTEGLQPLVLPAAALGALLPIVFSHSHALDHATNLGFRIHFLSAMLAYGLFTLAALHALLMGFAEKRLHQRSLSRGLITLPPLMTMESLLFRMVWAAFVLLSVAVGSGIFFSETIYGRPLTLDHKTLFALVSWVLVAGLLTGRHYWGWRGRVAQRWLIAGFVALILAYVGSRFVAEVLLGR